MTAKSKRENCNQRTAIGSPTSRLRTSRKRCKSITFQCSALCLLTLALSFSATTAALALIDLSSVRQVVNDYGQTTGDKNVSNSANQYLNTVDDYLRQSQDFYRNITRKNLGGIINQLESILGQQGILSPSELPRTIDDIYGGIPTTPAQSYQKQQVVTDTANSDQLWSYIDSVLGNGKDEGQSLLTTMDQTSAISTEASIEGQQKSVNQSESTAQSAELAQTAADATEQLSQQAQTRNVSQAILQDEAAQLAQMAKSNSAIAAQLASLSNQQALSAGQMAALSTQSQVTNEHLTQLRAGQAIGNIQMHDVFNAQRHANNMAMMEHQQNAQLSLEATNAIYIPGFFSEQTADN